MHSPSFNDGDDNHMDKAVNDSNQHRGSIILHITDCSRHGRSQISKAVAVKVAHRHIFHPVAHMDALIRAHEIPNPRLRKVGNITANDFPDHTGQKEQECKYNVLTMKALDQSVEDKEKRTDLEHIKNGVQQTEHNRFFQYPFPSAGKNINLL